MEGKLATSAATSEVAAGGPPAQSTAIDNGAPLNHSHQQRVQELVGTLLAAVEAAAFETAARRSNLRQCYWVEATQGAAALRESHQPAQDPRMTTQQWDEAEREMAVAVATQILRVTSQLSELNTAQGVATAAGGGESSSFYGLPPPAEVQPLGPESPSIPTATPIPSIDNRAGVSSNRPSLGVKRPHSSLEEAALVGTPRMVAFVTDMPQGGTLFRRVFDMTGGPSGASALLSAARAADARNEAPPTTAVAAAGPSTGPGGWRSSDAGRSSDVIVQLSATPSFASPTRLTAAVNAVAELSKPLVGVGNNRPPSTLAGAPGCESSAKSRVKNLISRFESHTTPKRGSSSSSALTLRNPMLLPSADPSGAPAPPTVPSLDIAAAAAAATGVTGPARGAQTAGVTSQPLSLYDTDDSSASSSRPVSQQTTPLRSGGRLIAAAVPASVQLWSARRDAAQRMANIAEEEEDDPSSHGGGGGSTMQQLQRSTGTPTLVPRRSEKAAASETTEAAAVGEGAGRGEGTDDADTGPGPVEEDAINAFLNSRTGNDDTQLTKKKKKLQPPTSRQQPQQEQPEAPLIIDSALDIERLSCAQPPSTRECQSADLTAAIRAQKKRYVKMCLSQAPPPSVAAPPPAVIPVAFASGSEDASASTHRAPTAGAPPGGFGAGLSTSAARPGTSSQIPQLRKDKSAASRESPTRAAAAQTPRPPKVQRMHRTLKPLGEKNWDDQADLSDEEGMPKDGRRNGLKCASWAKNTSEWHALVKKQQDIDPRSIFGCGSREADFKDLFRTPDFKRAETELKFSRNQANGTADMSSFDARKDRCKKWNADKKHCGFAPHEGVPMTAVRQFKLRVGQTRDISYLVWDDWSVCGGHCQHDSTVRQPWYQKLEMSPCTSATPGFLSGSSVRRCGSPLPAARTVNDPELAVEDNSTARRREPDSFFRGIFCTTGVEGWN